MAAAIAFRETHVLPDGMRITLRFIRPDDAVGLRRGFSRLSLRTRYQRFLAAMPELTDAMVEYLTNVDGNDHVAIVAIRESEGDLPEEGIGVARFVRLSGEPAVAEAAVTVVDEVQGKGIGRLLLRALVGVARTRGIETIRAEVLAENRQIRRLLDDKGSVLRADEGTTLVFDVPIHRLPELDVEPLHPLRRLLRAAAESLVSIVGS